MTIEAYEMRRVQYDMQCDECKQGYMRPTGMMLTSNPAQYPHRCNKCDHHKNYLVQYPHTEDERVR